VKLPVQFSAANERKVELRVRPHRQLGDGAPLPRRQRQAGQVEVAEDGERQREHHPVGHDIAGKA
jgi:hypothetical protein